MIWLIGAGSALYAWILFGPLMRQRRQQREMEADYDDE